MSASYASQKATEALSPLLSEGNLASRLYYSGCALIMFPFDSVPPKIQRRALILKEALTAYPGEHPEGTIKGTIALLPEDRKRHIKDEMLSFFQAVCEFKGQADIEKSLDRQYDEISLTSPDCWELLFWNLSPTCSDAERQAYSQYARHWLPDFPDEVLFEWLGRHGYHSLNTWAHLPLEKLCFTEVAWDFDKLKEIQALDSCWTEIGPSSHGGYQLNRPQHWLGEYIRKNGTWPAPIIVLENAKEQANRCGPTIPAGLVLIEGHRRLSNLLNLPKIEQQPAHRVWLARIKQG